MWIGFSRRQPWLNFLHKQLQLIYYLSIYLFVWFWFHAGLASSWANNTLWSIEWKYLIMVCSVFCKYILFSEMCNSHNSTMSIHLFCRSLTTQLGFHDVLSGIFYCLVSVLHTNYCGGRKARMTIAFFFQL